MTVSTQRVPDTVLGSYVIIICLHNPLYLEKNLIKYQVIKKRKKIQLSVKIKTKTAYKGTEGIDSSLII